MPRSGLCASLVALLLVALTTSLQPAMAATGCSSPSFVTSSPDGMWSTGRYVVHNNMWNTSGYRVHETLRACSARSWIVAAVADNRSGDGAVKTYPNVHRDFHNWSTGREPRLSSFSRISSSFAARTPRVGIYDVAYDIWLNGVADAHSNEVMIWTDNYRQQPSGSVVARGLRFAGRHWRVYATGDDSYLAFVPRRRMTHGTLPLRRMLGWLVRHHRISARSTLGQVCYGIEVVSTGGRQARFQVTNFSLTTRR